MQYKELYKILMLHRASNPGFSYDDRSGWRRMQSSYIDMIRPLWIIAEDRANGHRIWITQSGSDMSVTIGRMDDQGRNISTICTFRCKGKKCLAEIVRKVLEEPESHWAQSKEAV